MILTLHKNDVRDILKKELESQGMDLGDAKIEVSGAKITSPQKGDPWEKDAKNV